jgi:ribonucleoside-diphosphate reductase alpha chain
MFRRVASAVAANDARYYIPSAAASLEEMYYGLMARLEFLPNSPALLNAGRNGGQLSSCFYLPPDQADLSVSGLIRNAEIVHRGGGGTAFTFSGIPAGYRPVEWISPLSEAVMAVKQGGIRQGCSIVLLDVHHPCILDFIRSKDDPRVLSNFYLGVALSDEFMQAVKSGDSYPLRDPAGGECGELDARQVFDSIVMQTWKTGDPGVVFRDRIENGNPVPHLGKVEGVSGCGEQMLLPYESCVLGSINLARMISPGGAVDFNRLRKTVSLAVRFLDNLIDINHYPLPEVREITLQTRKVGLGVMGFADLLIRLGLPYDSKEALETAERVMGFINRAAHEMSSELARERGVFPGYAGSTYDRPGGRLMRNASLTTVAPTGTISIIAGCSGGIEPLFSLVFMRHVLEGDSLLEVNPDLVRVARRRGFYSDELLRQLAGGTRLRDIKGVPEDVRRLFVTGADIASPWHVDMQAAVQRHVDNAVSKTVNLPAQATPGDVACVYFKAFEMGLKGITIYRDRSRPNQPLSSGTVDSELLEAYLRGDELNAVTAGES